jgi:hypothetical protein
MDEKDRRDHTFRIALIIACWVIALSLFIFNLLAR